MRIRNLHVLIVVCVMYAAAQMLADITSLRGLAIAGLSFNAFTLVYPLTFTLRDMAHKLAGPNVARTIIITSALIYLLTQGFFWLISQLPPEMTAEERTVLGELLQTDWRFLLAAVAATVVSQLLDTELYTWWKKRYGQRKQWGRALLSNVVSIPADRLLFLLLAFAGLMSLEEMMPLFATATVARLAVGLISIPGIYLVEEHSKDWHFMEEVKHQD